MNLVILIVFLCALEPIDLFFSTDMFFVSISIAQIKPGIWKVKIVNSQKNNSLFKKIFIMEMI